MFHQLKILPAHFESIISGDKRFEIRDNTERGFQKGDEVELLEFERKAGPIGKHSGRTALVTLTYVSNFNQKEGFVVFGFNLVSEG